MTVNAGACALACEAAAAPSSARNARPDLTSEAVIESQREAQRLAGRHRLSHIHPQSAPIDPEPEAPEPAREPGEAVRGQPARALAPEPGLPPFTQGPAI